MTTAKKATTTRAKKPTTKAKVVKASQSIPDLPNNPFVYEIFEVVAKQRTIAKKVEALKKFEHPCLKTIFIWNFDETVVSLLPTGDVPYAAIDGETGFNGTLTEKIEDAISKMEELGTHSLGANDQGKTTLRKEYTKFYNFVKGGNPGLSNLRRETMFINILSGLHPLEAQIVCLIKDKKLETKYKISKDIVSKAYPDINWGNRS
tara:strand:+ start:565 stop:1179 length:615 start_codon:yes stop_codon:yes gene_type:complete